MDTKQNTPKLKVKLVNQGTYGCVYRPGIQCPSEAESNSIYKEESSDFITKLHAQTNAVQIEISISELIKTIPQYSLYFAPILTTCQVDLAKIDLTNTDKCEFLETERERERERETEPTQQNTSITSTKMKYIEGKTMESHIYYLIKTQMSPDIIRNEIMHLYAYLDHGIDALITKKIVHFDFKENNVIVKNTGEPIIIDYGISIIMEPLLQTDNITIELLHRSFYTYFTEYVPWCPEIHIINYIVNVKKTLDVPITRDEIATVLNEVFANNKVIEKLPTLNPAFEKYKSIFYQSQMTYDSKALVKTLLQTFHKWDKYANALICIDLLDIINKATQTDEPLSQKQLQKITMAIFG